VNEEALQIMRSPIISALMFRVAAAVMTGINRASRQRESLCHERCS